jgi:protein-tyrosine phosphatase
MRERGITCVVNLRRSDDLKRGLEPGNYLHLPTPDNHPPSLEAIQEGVTFIDSCIKNGDVIYVHCGVGVGRAPTLVAAYLVYTGMRPDAAWELLRRKRPIIMPLPGQVQQVVSYYKHLQQVQAK